MGRAAGIRPAAAAAMHLPASGAAERPSLQWASSGHGALWSDWLPRMVLLGCKKPFESRICVGPPPAGPRPRLPARGARSGRSHLFQAA